MKLKIAVVQFEIKQFSPEENLKKAEKFMKKASSSKAKIIVFPEDFVTGPIMAKREYADSKQKYVKHFQNLAKKYKIDVVPGSIIEEDNLGLHNTTYYIESNGKIKTRYRKVNLWHPERHYITPGHEVPVFNTKYGKVGLIICWDLIFPEIFRKMVRKGVNIIICPSYWCYGDAGKIGNAWNKNSEINLVDSLCIGRAFENGIVLVYCNAGGKLQAGKITDTLIGHSQIDVPFKGALKKLNHNKEEMFIQEIDTSILKDSEKVYKIRDDLKKRILC
ncbi:MAG: carbon-nitrogen hydrolase family protein [Nanoarchaeota archaeon]